MKILKIFSILCVLVIVTGQLSAQTTATLSTLNVKTSVQLKTVKVTDIKLDFGADSTSNTKIATIKAVRDWVNLARFGLMAYIETRVTGGVNVGWGLLFVDNTLRVDPAILTGTASHTGTPTVSVSTGAGTGPSGVSINGTDMRGEVWVTTGTSPVAGGVVITVNFAEAFAAYPFVQVTGADAPTALKIPFTPNVSPTFFRIITANGLAAGTSYKFTYATHP